MTNTNPIWKIACRGLIIHEGQLMTVKLRSTDDFYCLPWGKLDAMETLEDCIAREIYEELNVQPVIWPLLYLHQWLLEQQGKHMIEFFYLITNWADFRHVDLSQSSHGFEISEIRRVDLDDCDVNLQPSFVAQYMHGKTVEQLLAMWVQSVVSH